MSQPFIVCGNSPTLLTTRRLVLAHGGIRSRIIFGTSSLPQQIDGAIVLCRTLSETEQIEVIRHVRTRQPDAPILRIGDGHIQEQDDLYQVSDLAGPEAFLSVATRIAATLSSTPTPREDGL